MAGCGSARRRKVTLKPGGCQTSENGLKKKGDIQMAKIGVFFSAGYEEIEALTVVDLCRRAGIEVTMVSVDETAAVTGSHQITVQMDQLLSETDFDAFDLLVLPGECLEPCIWKPVMD